VENVEEKEIKATDKGKKNIQGQKGKNEAKSGE
jgi:hypothetical protein